jgi:hypothetical protein
MNVPENDDAVGYKRPPKNFRWKKGQCGNPGRKRKYKRKGVVEIIDQLFAKRMKVVDNGSTRSMSGLALIVTQLVKKELANERGAMSVRLKYEAFALRQNGSRDILLISDPTQSLPQDGETHKEAERADDKL